MSDVPFGERLEAKNAPTLSIPLVGRRFLTAVPLSKPIDKDVPIVIQTVRTMAPIRRACDNEINAVRRELTYQIVGVAMLYANSFLA